MPIDTLTASVGLTINWTAQDNLTGTDYGSVENSSTIQKKLSVAATVANAVAGGADEVVSYLLTIAGGGSADVDLTDLTNVLQQAASFARLKQIIIRLLSTTDDNTNGTAATSITVGNASANGAALFMGAVTHTITIPNGGFIAFGTPAAAGLVITASTADILKIANNDGSVAAKVQLTLIGGSD